MAMKGNASENTDDNQNDFSSRWAAAVKKLHKPVLAGIQAVARISAVHPKKMVASAVAFSVGIFVLGILTNFSVDVDEDALWTPKGAYPITHLNWIDDESGFPTASRMFVMVFHQDGDRNILGRDQVGRIFEAVDSVRTLPGYQSVCSRDASGDCPISGVTKFWNNTASIFENADLTEDEVVEAMSVLTYPDDGTPVSTFDIFGNSERDSTGQLIGAQTYVVTIEIPQDDEDRDESISEDFEEPALDAILELDEKWELESGNAFRVEVIAERSFTDEFERAIVDDIPLLPTVFVVMGLFTSAIFFKRDRVRSRSFLGFMAVITVLLSIVAGYGLMFLCAVPFTSMTQILPFVFFGVGLDDAFIITGSYFRFEGQDLDPVERVKVTMDDIGISIFLTTLTSSLAFALGMVSTIPAIFWLCAYAVPTIIFIFIMQLTFFTACLVLDEHRIQAGNRDCLRCIKCARRDDTTVEANKTSPTDRFMAAYAEKLLNPYVKVVVLVAFAAIAVACAISTSQLEQAFDFKDVLPSDSYITRFFDAFEDYSERSSISPAAYFRNVDQSDEMIQDQMEKYVNELVTIDAIVEQPDFCWFRDFRSFVQNNRTSATDFVEQLDDFLADDVNGELYSDHIVRDADGSIFASRCVLNMDNIDIENVKQQIDALKDQRAITEAQEVNKGRGEFSFFTYDGNYNIWEFYSVSADEIMLTTILSVAAVTGVTFLMVPHWSAALFVLPVISVLYIDMLGVMQWAGVSINPVTYIAIIMSIGLLIDFILHVLLRYYESSGTRKEKTVEMLCTMGSSILIGAITTFLGTMPLALSASDIFFTIFIAFLALVVLGSTHGLILLPVVLSMVGPEGQVSIAATATASNSRSGSDADSRREETDLEEIKLADSEDTC